MGSIMGVNEISDRYQEIAVSLKITGRQQVKKTNQEVHPRILMGVAAKGDQSEAVMENRSR